MKGLQHILAEYRALGIVSGGQILLRPADALTLVDGLERRGARIVGVAAWRAQDKQFVELRPYGFIGDDHPDDVAANAASARSLIEERIEQKADYVAIHFESPELGETFDRRFLPRLREVAEEIRKEFPDVRVSVGSWPGGGRTPLQSWTLGISCLLPEVPSDQSDLVDLTIDFMHVSTDPKIMSADVVWGHPSGYVEAELPVDGVPLSEEALQEIEKGLPTLVEALRKALRRGKPGSEAD